MATTRTKSALLAQGKERRVDGGRQPWRVRLYGPAPGEAGYQVSRGAFLEPPAWLLGGRLEQCCLEH